MNLLLAIILAAAAAVVECNPNHSGVCEGPPITAEEYEEVQDILRELKARAVPVTNGEHFPAGPGDVL